MKSIKYILAISVMLITATLPTVACGPYYPENPASIRVFRSCTPDLERQWQEGCRFQDYEKYENCLLWQKITSTDIPLKDIEHVVYDARINDILNFPQGKLAGNKFLLLSGKKRQNHIFSTNIISYTCFTKKGLSFEAM